MFSHEINSLLKKPYNVIWDFRCISQEDFGEVFTVVYDQVYEELRIEEIYKEKIDREVKEEEELDQKIEWKERQKEEKIKNGEEIEEKKEEFNYICFFYFLY
jgi:hypothetical protein